MPAPLSSYFHHSLRDIQPPIEFILPSQRPPWLVSLLDTAHNNVKLRTGIGGVQHAKSSVRFRGIGARPCTLRLPYYAFILDAIRAFDKSTSVAHGVWRGHTVR
jgi:hypothetical protein